MLGFGWGVVPPAGSVKDKGRIATIIEFLIYLTPIRKEKCSAIQCQSLICDCIVALIVLLTATAPFGSSTLIDTRYKSPDLDVEQ